MRTLFLSKSKLVLGTLLFASIASVSSCVSDENIQTQPSQTIEEQVKGHKWSLNAVSFTVTDKVTFDNNGQEVVTNVTDYVLSGANFGLNSILDYKVSNDLVVTFQNTGLNEAFPFENMMALTAGQFTYVINNSARKIVSSQSVLSTDDDGNTIQDIYQVEQYDVAMMNNGDLLTFKINARLADEDAEEYTILRGYYSYNATRMN